METFLSSPSVLEFAVSSEPQVTVILKISHRRELAFASLSSLAREIKHGLELVIVDGTASHDASDAETFKSVEGCIWMTVRRGCQEPPESLARGTLSKGFSRNLGKPLSLPSEC